jgi:hypothetical protein
MPKSDNVITVRLNETQMKKYHEGKVFTLKASDINNLENHEVRLHFNAKKHLTRLIKNFNKGTGTRISPNDLVDVKVKMGNGMFDSLKKVMSNPIAQSVLKAAMPIATNLVGQQVKNLTGSDALSNASKSLLKDGTNELTKGSGFNFNDILKSKITKSIVKAALPIASNLVGQQVKNLTGSDALAGVSKSLINEGGKEVTGSGYRLHGVKRVTKKGGSFLQLGGSVNENVRLANMDMMNNGIGLTSTAPHFSDPTPMQRKMSELRAMRGRKNI